MTDTVRLRRHLVGRREAQGLTRRQLAERMHTTIWTVEHLENGRRTPDLVMLARWAKALGLCASVVLDDRTAPDDHPETCR